MSTQIAATARQSLDVAANEPQVTYAVAQLGICQAALCLWQQRLDKQSGDYSPERILHELAYYRQQMTRWQQYLAALVS